MSVGSTLVCSIAIRSAYNNALGMLGYQGRRAVILTYRGPLKTPTPTIFMFPSPYGVHDTSV